MNKKEQAMVDALKQRIALSWPRYEEPKPMDLSGASSHDLKTGWFSSQYGTDYQVSLGCSSGVFHSRTRTDKTDCQQAGTMYHTKLDALKVARCRMSAQFATALARIDAEIEAEEVQNDLMP